MFMAGAYQNKPELRPASIKGNMRFIWRAIQRADDIDVLRKAEGEIFGNAFGGRETKSSDFRIRIENESIPTGSEIMVPHRNHNDYDGQDGPFPGQAVKTDGTFDVVISSFSDVESHRNYVRLFILTCLMYGFGRRSRKGFGTVVITDIDGIGDDISTWFLSAAENLDMLSIFNARYEFASDVEIAVSGGGGANYPYIENIKLFGSREAAVTAPLIQETGMAVHKFSSNPFLGTSDPRFASSIILSTAPWNEYNYVSIVTQLHCTVDFEAEERDKFYTELYGRV